MFKKSIFVFFVFFSLTVAHAQTWSQMGTFNDTIMSTCSMDGKIYAGGIFTNASGKSYVAEWNSTTSTWQELGVGANALNANDSILAIYCNVVSKKIYAAGQFTNGSGSRYVAEWDPTTSTWSELGALNANEEIDTIAGNDSSGKIYVGGLFTNGDGNKYVAEWDPSSSSWNELSGLTDTSPDPNDFILSLFCNQTSGKIYAGGFFTNSSGKRFVGVWDGTNWSELQGTNSLNANNWIFSVTGDSAGNVYTAGKFTNTSGQYYVAKWTASTTTWSQAGNGLNGRIFTIYSDPSSNLYTGGDFKDAGAYNVKKLNGTTWDNVGSPALLGNDIIQTIVSDNAGGLYAAGDFTNTNGDFIVSRFGWPTGVETVVSEKNKIIVYPNPVQDVVNVQLDKEVNNPILSITGLDGKTLIRQSYKGSKNKLSVDISNLNLNQGIYVLNLEVAKNGNKKAYKGIKNAGSKSKASVVIYSEKLIKE